VAAERLQAACWMSNVLDGVALLRNSERPGAKVSRVEVGSVRRRRPQGAQAWRAGGGRRKKGKGVGGADDVGFVEEQGGERRNGGTGGRRVEGGRGRRNGEG
jgi:hypothetical protein